jgi:hypothetical protein
LDVRLIAAFLALVAAALLLFAGSILAWKNGLLTGVSVFADANDHTKNDEDGTAAMLVLVAAALSTAASTLLFASRWPKAASALLLASAAVVLVAINEASFRWFALVPLAAALAGFAHASHAARTSPPARPIGSGTQLQV